MLLTWLSEAVGEADVALPLEVVVVDGRDVDEEDSEVEEQDFEVK